MNLISEEIQIFCPFGDELLYNCGWHRVHIVIGIQGQLVTIRVSAEKSAQLHELAYHMKCPSSLTGPARSDLGIRRSFQL